MVVVSKPAIQELSCLSTCGIPLIDLCAPDAKHLIVNACTELGFFKVVNHGVPMETISTLQSESAKFFSLPLSEKQSTAPPPPFGYGNNQIGRNGDVGSVEYLLLQSNSHGFLSTHKLRCALNEYVWAVKKMACEILELMAEGLKIEERNALSKLLMDEESDSIFRVNHYPPCPREELKKNIIGFGEHTDPQIISVLRSNNTSGLQISLPHHHGNWISVPPDETSFFINVGDSLQVMTNGRFKSVKHRVLTNSLKSRISMIYFCGPPLSEKIAPLPSLMKGEESLYKEFTWFEYKRSAYNSRLADNRLVHFERIAAS